MDAVEVDTSLNVSLKAAGKIREEAKLVEEHESDQEMEN